MSEFETVIEGCLLRKVPAAFCERSGLKVYFSVKISTGANAFLLAPLWPQ
jgi:hypothetical protein